MKDKFLDINKIDSALKKFVGVFDNARKYKLFENFVKCQVDVKNNFFEEICKKNEKLMKSFFNKFQDIDFLNEKFVFYQLVLFLNPDKVGKIFEEYSKIIYSNIHYKSLNKKFEKLSQFNPDGKLIIFFRANDFNAFLDILIFINLKESGENVNVFFDYVIDRGMDYEYVFQILKQQFDGFLNKEMNFLEFMEYFDFVYNVSIDELTSNIKERSLEFLIELMSYDEFSAYFVRHLATSNLMNAWTTERLLNRYLHKIFEFSVRINENHQSLGRAFILFFTKIYELNYFERDIFSKRDSLFDFASKSMGEYFQGMGGDILEHKKFLENFENAKDFFNLVYCVYLMKKSNYVLSFYQKKNILKILKEINWKNINPYLMNYFEERNVKRNDNYSFVFERDFFLDLIIVGSLNIFLRKKSFGSMIPELYVSPPYLKNSKENYRELNKWIFDVSLFSNVFQNDSLNREAMIFGRIFMETEFSDIVRKLYPSIEFIVEDFHNKKKIINKK